MMEYADAEDLAVACCEYMWEYSNHSIAAHRNYTVSYPQESHLDGEDVQVTQENSGLRLFK